MTRQRFTPNKKVCNCDADHTQITTVIETRRGNPKHLKRSQQIHHRTGNSFFVHWKDQTNLIGIPKREEAS